MNSQTSKTKTQPYHYLKRAKNTRQTSYAFQNQTPSFNLRSSMKSTPISRDTHLQVEAGRGPLTILIKAMQETQIQM